MLNLSLSRTMCMLIHNHMCKHTGTHDCWISNTLVKSALYFRVELSASYLIGQTCISSTVRTHIAFVPQAASWSRGNTDSLFIAEDPNQDWCSYPHIPTSAWTCWLTSAKRYSLFHTEKSLDNYFTDQKEQRCKKVYDRVASHITENGLTDTIDRENISFSVANEFNQTILGEEVLPTLHNGKLTQLQPWEDTEYLRCG